MWLCDQITPILQKQNQLPGQEKYQICHLKSPKWKSTYTHDPKKAKQTRMKQYETNVRNKSNKGRIMINNKAQNEYREIDLTKVIGVQKANCSF